jgi:hypothetical protein
MADRPGHAMRLGLRRTLDRRREMRTHFTHCPNRPANGVVAPALRVGQIITVKYIDPPDDWEQDTWEGRVIKEFPCNRYEVRSTFEPYEEGGKIQYDPPET